MIKVVVFDFDGVIIRRSEFFKQEAWGSVFVSYGEKGMEAFREAEKMYGGGRGGDRFDILRSTFEKLGEPAAEIPRLVEEGAQNFDKIVQQKIFDAGITNEDRELLELLSKRLSVYLNSATPKEALERTVDALQLKSVIVGVLGRPNTKVENFKFVAERESAQPNEILFVGDGESDFKAAQEFGCLFLGLGNEWNGWGTLEKSSGGLESLGLDIEKSFAVIRNLNEVEEFLEK